MTEAEIQIPHSAFRIQKHPNYCHDRPRHTIVKQRGLDWNLWPLRVKII